ncbi:histone deacetylase [Puniceicoccaceae bacterium K14]|nr:histone deacetylase [Puniceicoccaceae bacterium K14]
MLSLFYHRIYTDGLSPNASFPRDRYRLLEKRLKDQPNIDLLRPRRAEKEEITSVHDSEYVNDFLKGTLSEKAIRRIGLRPWTSEIVERTLRVTGGSLQATEHALKNRTIAGNMAGGTHHAYRDFGSGYCIFNDVAICALAALQRPEVNRVLSLDLDVHQGDGTASILSDEQRVFTCSIHSKSNFPFRKQTSDLDVPLDDEIGDEAYLEYLDETLNEIQPENFDLILFQAGVDSLRSDALGKLALSREGLQTRNQRVFQYHKNHGIPLVIFMGGGYAKPIHDSIDAFEDLFTAAAEYASQPL